MAKKKVKCPVCGHMLGNPNDPRHVKSPKHQEALKVQQHTKGTITSYAGDSSPEINKLSVLESRITSLEEKFDKLVSPYKKIKIEDFKSQLFIEYTYLNPSRDISGVDFEILKRRTCRKLEISYDYFEDLIYDIQRRERIITIQAGRGKKYIQIKMT
ncbi:MAG: hypothetical protein ACFFG0_08550 [Candidatus Thorarchaeota archaeon]